MNDNDPGSAAQIRDQDWDDVDFDDGFGYDEEDFPFGLHDDDGYPLEGWDDDEEDTDDCE